MDENPDRDFLNIPGGTYELPPLLIGAPTPLRMVKVMDLACEIVAWDAMPQSNRDVVIGREMDPERRKMDLAVQFVDQYFALRKHWRWGESILEWIRQCEITFSSRIQLRNVLKNDTWPHAGRCCFVTLLEASDNPLIRESKIDFEKAVGLRLAFRRFPQISNFCQESLAIWDKGTASGVYQTWSQLQTKPLSYLPPKSFTYHVVNLSSSLKQLPEY